MENKKKWHQKNGWITALLILFFPVGLFLMWKYASWNKKIKWGISIFFLLFVILSKQSNQTSVSPNSNNSQSAKFECIGPDGKKMGLSPKACDEFNNAWRNGQQTQNLPTPTPKPTTTPTITPKATIQPTAAPTATPKPTDKPTVVSKKIIDKINNLATEKYPNFEVTIWNKNSDFASEGEIPYEIILNGSFNKTIVSSCDAAKRLSYYMLEAFYKDSEIRPTLSRVMITIPYYLRVSLGATDGVPMAQNGSFSGPTNFWTVMEKVGLGEKERGEMKNRTWGTYLTSCE